VASEERLRELEEKYEGYSVYDNRGDKIGKVDDLFIDEADREEYIGVKMGFLGRKSTLIPMDIVRVNEADRAIEVSESKDHVKDAPSFDDDEDITPEYEERIRSHFGLQSHDPSDSRSGTYAGSSGAAAGAHEGSESDQDRDDSAQGDRADSDSSAVDTEYGERTGSSAGGAASRFERGSSTEGSAGAGESTAEGGASGTPRTRETEETETFEEGGRTKVRRRIIREEIGEEDS
jgi:sporulation protein YlmC with PRC-barrel domain